MTVKSPSLKDPNTQHAFPAENHADSKVRQVAAKALRDPSPTTNSKRACLEPPSLESLAHVAGWIVIPKDPKPDAPHMYRTLGPDGKIIQLDGPHE